MNQYYVALSRKKNSSSYDWLQKLNVPCWPTYAHAPSCGVDGLSDGLDDTPLEELARHFAILCPVALRWRLCCLDSRLTAVKFLKPFNPVKPSKCIMWGTFLLQRQPLNKSCMWIWPWNECLVFGLCVISCLHINSKEDLEQQILGQYELHSFMLSRHIRSTSTF